MEKINFKDLKKNDRIKSNQITEVERDGTWHEVSHA